MTVAIAAGKVQSLVRSQVIRHNCCPQARQKLDQVQYIIETIKDIILVIFAISTPSQQTRFDRPFR
jgi:hypothetical protein